MTAFLALVIFEIFYGTFYSIQFYLGFGTAYRKTKEWGDTGVYLFGWFLLYGVIVSFIPGLGIYFWYESRNEEQQYERQTPTQSQPSEEQQHEHQSRTQSQPLQSEDEFIGGYVSEGDFLELNQNEWQSISECEWQIDDNCCLEIKNNKSASFMSYFDIDAVTELGTLRCGDISSDGKINWPWLKYSSHIQKVKIGEGVQAVSLRNMFANCTSLVSVNLIMLNTSNATDMSYMFSNCKSLTSLDLSTLELENITKADHMFYRCDSLTDLYLPACIVDPEKVTPLFPSTF